MYDVAAVYKVTSKIQLLSLPVFSVLATGCFSASVKALYSTEFNPVLAGHYVRFTNPRAHTAMRRAKHFMPFTVDTDFHKASRLG